jgi:hypothetical protein
MSPLSHEASFSLEPALRYDSSQSKPQLSNATDASSGTTDAPVHDLPAVGCVVPKPTTKPITLSAAPPLMTAPLAASTVMAHMQQTHWSASYALAPTPPPSLRHRKRRSARPAQRLDSESAIQLAVAQKQRQRQQQQQPLIAWNTLTPTQLTHRLFHTSTALRPRQSLNL